jgi:hypothetical protein
VIKLSPPPLGGVRRERMGRMVKAKNREAKMIVEKILERYDLPDVFEVTEEELKKIRQLVIMTQSMPAPLKTKFRGESNA